MRVTELADVAGIEIQIKYVPSKGKTWVAELIKPFGLTGLRASLDSVMVERRKSTGKCPEEALNSLCELLKEYEALVIEETEYGRSQVYFKLPHEITK